MNNIFLGAGARLARYIRNESIRQMVMQASEDFKTGGQLLLFPEGTRTIRQPVNPLKGSIALISAQAQVPIQTVLIETNSRYLSKGWSLFRKPMMPVRYHIRLGKRFDPPADSHELMHQLETYFTEQLHPQFQEAPLPDSATQLNTDGLRKNQPRLNASTPPLP